MDLTEAEDIKKRWQEYTEELYKKDLKGYMHPMYSTVLYTVILYSVALFTIAKTWK